MWKKYCRAGQATDDNMAHAHFMPIPKATNPHSQYVTLMPFSLQKGCTKAPQSYTIRM